jgi:hypothetical protein
MKNYVKIMEHFRKNTINYSDIVHNKELRAKLTIANNTHPFGHSIQTNMQSIPQNLKKNATKISLIRRGM